MAGGAEVSEAELWRMRRRPWGRQVEIFLATTRIDGEDVEIPLKTFTDLSGFFKGGKHALIQGMTGFGKTHLQLTLVRELLGLGFKCIWRDDGGLEFAQLLPHVPGEMHVFHPEDTRLRISGDWGDRLRIHTFDHRSRGSLLEIFKTLYNAPPGSVAVVVFDVYVLDPELSARFWADFFILMLHFVMQKPYDKKQPWVLAIDQINEIVQSQGHETTEQHRKVRSLLEHNIRNVRKHRITILATTHRFPELPPSLRSQFSYHFIKRSEGADIYDFANRKLLKASAKLFWWILREITTMGPDQVFILDEDGNYDRARFDPFPWDPSIRVQAQGVVSSSLIRGRRFDVADILIALLLYQGASYGQMEQITGLDRSTCLRRAKRIITADDRIADELAHIAEIKRALWRAATKKKERGAAT